MDGDGDLDLAVGIGNDDLLIGDQIYENVGGALTLAAGFGWEASEKSRTQSMAWGDVDGDGDLDLAVGNWGHPNKVYRNENGTLQPTAFWSSADRDNTRSVAWGDMDGDGDLDLAVGNWGVNKIYQNENGRLNPVAAWISVEEAATERVVWADVEGDLDLTAANWGGKCWQHCALSQHRRHNRDQSRLDEPTACCA